MDAALSEDTGLRGGRHWYIVETLSGQERKAKFHLERQAFETYLPMRITSHGRSTGAAPLFPGYLFVSLDPQVQRWLAIYSTLGVFRLMGARNGRPAHLAEEVIALIRSREIEGLIRLLPKGKSRPDWQAGQRLKVAAGGPFAGLEAIFEEQVDEKRCWVLLSFLGRESRALLPVGSLSPAVRTPS